MRGVRLGVTGQRGVKCNTYILGSSDTNSYALIFNMSVQELLTMFFPGLPNLSSVLRQPLYCPHISQRKIPIQLETAV